MVEAVPQSRERTRISEQTVDGKYYGLDGQRDGDSPDWAGSGMQNGLEKAHGILPRDGRPRENKHITVQVGNSQYGTKYHVVSRSRTVPFPYRTVPVPTALTYPDFYRAYHSYGCPHSCVKVNTTRYLKKVPD